MHQSKAAKKMFSIFMIFLLLLPLIFPNQVAAQTSGTPDLTFKEEAKLEKTKEKESQKQPNNDNQVNEYKVPSLLDDWSSEEKTAEDLFVMDGKVEAKVMTALESEETVDVIIKMKDAVDLSKLSSSLSAKSKNDKAGAVVDQLQTVAKSSQSDVMKQLKNFEKSKEVSKVKQLWVINGISATVTKDALAELAKRKDIKSITEDFEILLPEFKAEETKPRLPEWGLEKIFAPRVWGEYDLQGEGIVVGIMDTGVSGKHEALRHNYRGRDGQHQYSWIDVSGNGYETPNDGQGHGTHVAGSAVGGGEGEPIGVAPGADWIAAKIFDDNGRATASGIHQAFEWFLAPGGDPSKAPNVVNNSWGSADAYRTEFLPGVQAWVAAGIFPLFAAGNDGPGPQTVGSPGSFVESFSIGATDRHDQIAAFSSRGPVFWLDENGERVRHVKPEVSAPGHQIYSALPNGGYGVKSGTSMATPHVAGAIALILQSQPNLTIDEVADLLENTARTEDHMGNLPNDSYGHGIVNVYQAVTEASFAGTLEGTLKDENGHAIPGELYFPDEDLRVSVKDNGLFKFKIREGTHKVEIQSFGYHSLTETIKVIKGEVLTKNWTLQQSEVVDVAGTVMYESGDPVPYAYVRIKDTPLKSVRTDGQGGFKLRGIPVDNYTFVISGSGIKQKTVSMPINEENTTISIAVESISIESAEGWATARNNYSRNAVSNAEIDADSLKASWNYASPGAMVFSSPVVADGKVVFTTDRGNVVAIDQDSGEEIWKIGTGNMNRSTPTIENGVVYVAGGGDYQVHAIDLNSGMKKWSTRVAYPAIYESPIYQDGVLYISSYAQPNAKVIALNAKTGGEIWSKEVGNVTYFGASLGQDSLYVGTYQSKSLTALSIKNGEEQWKKTVENEGFAASPVYEDGVVYAVSANLDGGRGTLRAFDASDGTELWTAPNIGNTEAGSPIVYDNLVIVGSADTPILKAFNKTNGELVWETDNGSLMLNSGSVSGNGNLYITDLSSNLKIYDVYSGELLRMIGLNYSSTNGVALAEGQVIAADDTGVFSFVAEGKISGKITNSEGEPVAAKISVVDSEKFTEADEKGEYALSMRPGTYTVKIAAYGYKQITEEITFVSGFSENNNYELEVANYGSVSGEVIDKRSGNPLENVSITVLDTPVNTKTDESGAYTLPEISEGTFDVLFSLAGYVDTIVPISVNAGENTVFDFDMPPIDVAVLDDWNGEIVRFLNVNNIAAEERGWDIIDEIGSYQVLYLNGAYTSGGKKPTEAEFEGLINAAEENDVSLVFADTWGPSYGSLRQLWEYRGDPAQYGSENINSQVRIRADVNHPIFEGIDKGVGLTTIENGHLAWFNRYSGRHLATVGTIRDGYEGTGIAYKGVSEASGHLLLSTHAASPWASPYNGWTFAQQQILLNSIEYIQDIQFGKISGSIEDSDGNPLDAKVEVADTGVYAKATEDGKYELFHDEGTYKVLVSKSGYSTKEVTVEVAHGQPVIEKIVLDVSESGTISGTITNKLTGQEISDAALQLFDEEDNLVNEVFSKINGSYEITEINEGDYNLEITLNDFVTQTIAVEVREKPVDLDIELYPAPSVGIIGDGSSKNLREILGKVGITAKNHTSINSLLPEIENLDVIFFTTQSTGTVTLPVLQSLLDEADKHHVSIIFGDDYYTGSGINHLVSRLGDPEKRTQHGITTSSAGYVVIEENPIFGKADVGDFINLLVPARSSVASFDGYSGYPLAYIKHENNDNVHGLGAAYKPRTADSMELLLSGNALGALRNSDAYTKEGQETFVNAILWASYIEFNKVQGTVTNESGEPLLAYVELPSESIGTWTDPETGAYEFGSIDGDFEIVVNSFGYKTHSENISIDENFDAINFVMNVKDDNGSIKGTFVDENTLEGINEAQIKVVDHPRTATTSVSGQFSIDNLEPGTYTLIVEKEGYVLQEFDVQVKTNEEKVIERKMKPTPKIGVVVDGQTTSAQTLKDYLTPRGYEVEQILYTDVERIKEFDLIFANSDYNNSLMPKKEQFTSFLKELDKTETPVIWTGGHGPRGSIPFLIEHTGMPTSEVKGNMPSGSRQLTAKVLEDHPILEGVRLDENNEFTFPTAYYYGFDGYKGKTIAKSSHDTLGELGSFVAYGGRTLKSSEVLLSTMVFGYAYSTNEYFDKNRERIVNNAITWALDSEEQLVGELHGTIKNNAGRGVHATITVEETGYKFETELDGSFFLAEDTGTYTLKVEAFGHHAEDFEVEFVRGEKSEKSLVMTSHEAGLIKGQVKAEDTNSGIENATIQIQGAPLKAVTDSKGNYEIQVPTGEYQVRVTANGYSPQIITASVEKNKEVTVNFTLTVSEKIAFVGTTINGDRMLPFLESEGYEADFWLNSTIDALMDELDNYALVILNDRHSSAMPEAKFKEFIDLADELGVSIIFPGQYGNGTIVDLYNFYKDPKTQTSGFVPDSYDFEVLEEHPIFLGYEVGDKITVIQHEKAGSNVQYNVFEQYSGTTIGEITHDDRGRIGGAVAYDFRTTSNVHILLDGLHAGSYGHPADRWTVDGKRIYTNAIDWALNASLGEINGTVADAEGNPIENATVTIPSLSLTTKTNQDGVYRLGVGIGEHEVRVQALGYISQTEVANVEQLGDVVELNFEMTKTDRMSVSGKVADMNDKGIANASLTLISPENKFEKVETTNRDGNYQFDQLLAGNYEITLEANGYQTVKRTFKIEAGEDVELDFTLSEFNIAVLGDMNNDLEQFFADNEFPAQSREWDIVDDVYNYDVIIVNSNKGTAEQVDKLLAESDKHETSLIFVDTWGPDGSMKLLEKATGNPKRAKQGYNEGAVFIDVDNQHEIFAGLEDSFKIHSEKSPYATFENYEGTELASIIVDDENKGTAIAYDFKGKNHMQVLLSSYAVTNIIGPNRGWTEDGKQLFLQVVEWARDGVQQLPEVPEWTVENDILTGEDFEVSGTAEYRSTVMILRGDEVLATIEPTKDNTFETEITGLEHGQYELTLKASNFAGEVTSEEVLHVFVDTKSPELEVESPTDNFVTGKEVVEVRGTVFDDNLDRLLVNGEELEVKNGEFLKKLILEEGTHTITVTAIDAVGHETTIERQVTVNLSAPVITDLEPATDQTLKPGDQIEISFRSETEGGEASFAVQLPGQSQTQATSNNAMEEVSPGVYKGTWTAPDMNLKDAVVIVELIDIAGNKTSEEATGKITVLTETEEPEVPELPTIKDVQPATDMTIDAGEEIEISFRSESEGGEAKFSVSLPSQANALSSSKNPMVEVEPGLYKGIWTAPNIALEGAVIEVELTDTNGNKVTQEAKGKITILPEEDEVEEPEPTGVDRISDDNRYLTAIEISKEGWTDADTVVLARGDNYADALAGVPYAHQLDAPILLTLTNNLYEETLAEIARLGTKKIVILGGESAISAKVAGELKAAGLTVERISGSDRFETAAKIAGKMGSSKKVVIANGMDFPDALSVAAHAAKAGMPILLTQADKLPAKTSEALKTLGVTETIVVGGKTVVSDKVVKQLPKPTTLAGPDRYETNIAIAKHFGVTSKHMYIATGQNYADALTGAVLAAKTDSSVILVHARVPEVVTTYITKQDLKRLTIFGGESAVSKKVANDLEKLIQ